MRALSEVSTLHVQDVDENLREGIETGKDMLIHPHPRGVEQVWHSCWDKPGAATNAK